MNDIYNLLQNNVLKCIKIRIIHLIIDEKIYFFSVPFIYKIQNKFLYFIKSIDNSNN